MLDWAGATEMAVRNRVAAVPFQQAYVRPWRECPSGMSPSIQREPTISLPIRSDFPRRAEPHTACGGSLTSGSGGPCAREGVPARIALQRHVRVMGGGRPDPTSRDPSA